MEAFKIVDDSILSSRIISGNKRTFPDFSYDAGAFQWINAIAAFGPKKSYGNSIDENSQAVTKTSRSSGNVLINDVAIGMEEESTTNAIPSEPTSRTNAIPSEPTSRYDLYQFCRKEFMQKISTESLEYGFSSPSEHLIHGFLSQYPDEFGGIIQHIYTKEIHHSIAIQSLLKAISYLPYERIAPFGMTLAMAACSNKDDEVKEAGIRAFEVWGHRDGITILKHMEASWKWLEDYRLETVAYLESL